MAISTNGTVLARLAGALYNTQMSNATYKEVAALDPSALADVLYARDFSASTDAAVATTLVTNLGLASVTGLDNWVAAQLTAAGSHKGAKVVELLNSFAQMTADTTYGAYATAFNTKVDAALALSQTTDNKGGTFEAAGVAVVADATFALSAGIDAVAGGAGNDTITATGATLTTYDSITGGAGTDTLIIIDSAATSAAGFPAAVTMSGVEKIQLTSTGSVGTNASLSSTTGVVAATAGTKAELAFTEALTAVTATNASATETVVIDGVTYTTATFTQALGTATATLQANSAAAAAAVKDVINSVLGSGVAVQGTLTGTDDHTFVITSPYAGGKLPTITVGSATSSATAAVTAAATTAQAEIVSFTVAGTGLTGTDAATTDKFSVNVGGVSYGSVNVGDSNDSAAQDTYASKVVTAINSALNNYLGTNAVTYATSVGKVVNVASTAAGTALPIITVNGSSTANAATVTRAEVRGNAVSTSAGSTTAGSTAQAYSVASYTDVTDFTAASVGGANISAGATTNVSVTNTGAGNILVSGGLADTISGAANSTYVSGAKGAVSVTTSSVPATGFYVASSATGLQAAWGSSTSYQAGVLVTGGTTVSVTEKAATTTGGVLTSVNGTTVQIGSPTQTSATATGGTQLSNAAMDPTGNVTVSVKTAFTSQTSGTVGFASAAYGRGTVSAYTNGATTASVTGAATVTLTDVATTGLKASTNASTVPGTSRLASVTLDGIYTSAAITSDALTSLTVTNTNSSSAASNGITITNNTANHNLALTVGNVGASSSSGLPITDAAATSVTIASQASAYQATNNGSTSTDVNAINSGSTSYVKLVAPQATSLTFTNGQNVQLIEGSNASYVDKVTAITATGAGRVTVDTTDTTTWARLTAIDAASATGAVYATITANQSFVGGAGNDKVTISAVPNYTVSGGAGEDKIVIGHAAALTGLSTSVTGFEVLGFGVDGLSTTAQGFSKFSLEATATSTGQTVTGLAAAAATISAASVSGTLNLTNAVNDHIALTVNLGTDTASTTGAATGQSALTLATTTASTAANHSTAGVASVTVNSAGITNAQVLNGGSDAYNTFTYAIADDLATVTVTGDSDITLTIGGGTNGAAKVTLLDASASSGDVTVTNTIASGKGVFATTGAVIKGGAGALTTSGSAGADTIFVGTGGATITGLGGGDTINIASGATGKTTLSYADATSVIGSFDVVTGFVNYGTAVTAGDISNVVDFSGTASIVSDTSTNSVTRVGSTDIYYTSKDGIVKFFTSTGAASTITSAVALIGAVETILDAADSSATANYIAAFELAGNTYVVASAKGTEGAAYDNIVELVGVVGLTAVSASTAAVHTLLVS